MTKEDALVVYELNCSQKGLEEFKEKISSEADKKKELLLEYPTVYLMNWGKNREYEVYVGETTDIIRRTLEHLSGARNGQNDWHALLGKNQSKMFVIGHDHFNKSLTLDIESKMMLYMSSVERVKKVHNRRTNQQKKYYTWMELEAIFSKIWERLGQYNPELFPLESVVKEAAIFKASPFHKLTEEQERLGESRGHGASPEQPVEKAPPLLTAVLIGDGIDPAVHMELAPVQGQLADVQVLSGNDQRSHAGGHDDAGLVEPLHVLHPGHRQPVPVVQNNPMRRSPRLGAFFVEGHTIPSFPVM